MEKVVASFEKNRVEDMRVRLTEYQGHHLVDVRVFATTGADGHRVPTKKGLSISYEKLPELIAALVDAEAELAARGLTRVGDKAA